MNSIGRENYINNFLLTELYDENTDPFFWEMNQFKLIDKEDFKKRTN